MEPAHYPIEALQKGIQGTVLIRALVGADGAVKDMLVLQSVHALLDNAALDAVRASTWKPATQEGKPVAVWIVVPIEFRLHD